MRYENTVKNGRRNGGALYNDNHIARRRSRARPSGKSQFNYNKVKNFEEQNIILLVIIDEYMRECLALDVARHFKGDDVVEVLRYLFIDELTYVADRWRMDYNHYRPHSSLDYMAPAAFAAMCLEQGSATLRLPQDRENKCEILS